MKHCWFGHNWRIVEQREQSLPIESLPEQPTKIGYELALHLTTKPVIVSLRCANCGKEKVERV